MTAPSEPVVRRMAVEHALFGVIPVLCTVFLAYHVLKTGIAAVDFRGAYRTAGIRLLRGTSPYLWSHRQIVGGEVFVYPALAAILFVPFGALPVGVGAALFTLICGVAGVLALRLVGARDWRLTGLLLVNPWFVSGWQTGNLTLPLMLGLALAWHYRDRPVTVGLLAALVISLKPLMWPVVVWLVCTRRLRAAAWTVAIGVCLNAIAWTVVGWSEIERYLRLSDRVTTALFHSGYGVISLVTRFGASRGSGVAVEVVLCVAATVGCLLAGRRRNDQAALACSVLLIFVASPLVWIHYFVLLVVPMALIYPRFRGIWLGPLLLWGCTVRTHQLWQIVLVWLVVGVTSTAMLSDWSIRSSRGVREPAGAVPC
jgi:hypothetical protein